MAGFEATAAEMGVSCLGAPLLWTFRAAIWDKEAICEGNLMLGFPAVLMMDRTTVEAKFFADIGVVCAL